MKNRIKRLLSAVLALVMIVSMMQPMALNAFADYRVDDEAICGICGHEAGSHMGVRWSDDCIEQCTRCEMKMGHCECAGKTWAECAKGVDSRLSEFPDTINGYSITWPDGCEFSDNDYVVFCRHVNYIFGDGDLWSCDDGGWVSIDDLTEKVYTVCGAGCQVIVGNPSGSSEPSDTPHPACLCTDPSHDGHNYIASNDGTTVVIYYYVGNQFEFEDASPLKEIASEYDGCKPGTWYYIGYEMRGVCEKAGGGSTHTHNSDAYGQNTAYHWTKCTDDEDNNGPLAEHTWNNGVCTVCSYPCAHAMFTEGQCAYCDYVCDHNGEIYGVCEICREDMGPDPFADLKAELKGKTEAEVCVYLSSGDCGGMNVFKQFRDVKEVRRIANGWQILDSKLGVLDVVYVSDTHLLTDGICERCGFVCDHNGAESGICGICHKYLSSTSEFLANIKAQLEGKTDAEVCVTLAGNNSEFTTGASNVLAKLAVYEDVTDIVSLGETAWDFNTSDNSYRLVLNQEHDFMDGRCLRCSFKDSNSPVNQLIAAIGDNECVVLEGGPNAQVCGNAAVISALEQMNGISGINHSGDAEWSFRLDQSGESYTLRVHSEHQFSGGWCSSCGYECTHGITEVTCKSGTCEICGRSYFGNGRHSWGAWADGSRTCQNCGTKESCPHDGQTSGNCWQCGMNLGGEPVDEFAECPICHHFAMEHQGVNGGQITYSNERIEMCHGCMSMGDCACAGKTWDECASGGSSGSGEPVDEFAECPICGHFAMDHQSVNGGYITYSNECIEMCDKCMGDCACAGKTWDECASGGSSGSGEPVDKLAKCPICGHFAMEHQSEQGGSISNSNERIEMCHGCMRMGDCACSGKTWAECANGGGTTPTISVTDVIISQEIAYMNVGGDTLTLSATVYPENATNKNVSWASDNAGVATVENGVVTAVAAGEAIITVTTEDGHKTDSCIVTVNAPVVSVTGVTLDKETASLKVGDTLTLNAAVEPENATNKFISWISTDYDVASVDEFTGLVTAVAPGTATIMAISEDPNLYAECVVTVAAPHTHNGLTFDKEIPAAGGKLTAGNYYLAEDLTLSANLAISGTVNLCLNGHVLKGAGSGSVISVPSGAVLNLFDCDPEAEHKGSMSGNVWTWDGGADTGSIAISGGIITSGYNTVKSDGGGGVLIRGTFNMNGGTVVGNTAQNSGHGGGVNVRGGAFNMNGGALRYNYSNSQGGGVFVAPGAKFTMNGGTIANNIAGNGGAGVYTNGTGSFTLNNGTISGNNSRGSQGGGGVRIENANCFTMNGGSITDNTAAYAGGGVNASNLIMNGGTISGNKSSGVGGGVSAGAVILGGDASITGNTRGSTVQNVYLADGRFITVNSSFTGTVGVTTANAAGAVISAVAVDEAFVQHFTADNSDLEVRRDADGKLIVAVPVYPVTGVTLDKTAASLNVGETLTLNAVVAPEGATNKNVSWASNNTGVATVANGVVTAVAAGTATITVTTEDGSFTASCTVTVAVPVVSVTGVTLDKTTAAMEVGETLTLNAVVAPENATNKNVTWESDNANVAAVENGVVTAAAPGEATITVTTEDGSFTASCTVTVAVPVVSVTGVTLDKTTASMKVGQTLTLTAVVAPEDADNKNVSWESNNTDAVTVENGIVTAAAPGEATITVTTEDGGFTASCVVTVVPQYRFTVTAAEGGRAEGSGIFSEGDNATARAFADKGYTFSHWEDASGNRVSANSTRTVAVMEDTTLTAVFEKLPTARIFVSLDVQEVEEEPEVEVNVAGKSFTVWADEPLAETSGEIVQGEMVTVIAHSTSDATFVRWQTEKGIVLSEKETYTFKAAEYNNVVAAYRVAGQTVTFTDRKGNVLSSRQYQATANAEDIAVPTAPAMFGYEFKGWKLSGKDTGFASEEEMKAAVLAEVAEGHDVTLNPVYEALPEKYTVTVKNGSGSGTYDASTALTVKAKAAPFGKYFAGWYEGEKLLTSSTSYSFYVTADRILEARFAEKPVEAVGTTSIETVSPNKSTKKISFVSVSSVPANCTIEKAGVIATSDAAVGTNAQKFTAATAAFVRYGTTTAHNYNYTWTKGSVTAGQTWYVRAYLVYTDANGNSHTVYGDIVAATLNGIVG